MLVGLALYDLAFRLPGRLDFALPKPLSGGLWVMECIFVRFLPSSVVPDTEESRFGRKGTSIPYTGRWRYFIAPSPDFLFSGSSMSLLSGTRFQANGMLRGGITTSTFIVILAFSLGLSVTNAAGQGNFMPAADLLPQSTAGFVRIPDLPEFRDAWQEMHIGKLMKDPSMKDFMDAQKKRAENYLNNINNKITVRPKDLVQIGTGEVAVAWLPFENDKRRPFAVCLIADIRGRANQAQAIVQQIDKDLKNAGAIRKDLNHRGQVIYVYSTKPKPGQLKVEQVAITQNDSRIIAADRDTVVQDLLDSIAGAPKGQPLSRRPDFQKILTQSHQQIAAARDGLVGVEWFATPFEMGRIMREVFEVDRGNDVDIIRLLEAQGFGAVNAAGGVASLAGNKYDILHHGHMLAARPLKLAAQMLNFFNRPYQPIPDWVHKEVGGFNRINWRLEKAFWASETLINEALGDEIFRDMVEGIRDDEEGPQIDIEKNFLPNLDDQILFLSDNTVPAAVDSERLLVAIRLKNAAVVRKVIRKAMEVEPDATKLDVPALPNIEIWQVQQGESDDDFGAELAELGIDEEFAEDENGQKPLLDHWAIAVVDKGPGSKHPYLIFSSHPQLLIDSAMRISAGGQQGSLVAEKSAIRVAQSIAALGGKSAAMDRMVQTRFALRTKYELLRKGELKDSKSIASTILRRLIEEGEGGQPDPLNARKLPPLNVIEKYMPDGGGFVQETNEGWSMTGFILK